jgi:LPXTG-motif cell wall-anchored protein
MDGQGAPAPAVHRVDDIGVSPSDLPRTGDDTFPTVAVGAALLGVGAGLSLLARRARHRPAD